MQELRVYSNFGVDLGAGIIDQAYCLVTTLIEPPIIAGETKAFDLFIREYLQNFSSFRQLLLTLEKS